MTHARMRLAVPPGAGSGYDLHTRRPPCPPRQSCLRMDVPNDKPSTANAELKSAPLLDAESAAFLQIGVSINAGACGSDGMPVGVRCCGCKVAPDRSSITLFVSKKQGDPVLRAVRENGALAAVFSQPTTHRTLQIKGRDTRIVPLDPEDVRLVATYRTAFARELSALGYDESLVYTVLSYPASDLTALRYTPAEIYVQTPGPKAGERIG